MHDHFTFCWKALTAEYFREDSIILSPSAVQSVPLLLLGFDKTAQIRVQFITD